MRDKTSDKRLLPCPFCGGEALLEHDDLCNWFVRCKKCFCRTPMSISKFFPITAWNTRKSMERIMERLEEEKKFYNSASYTDQAIRQGVMIASEIVREEGGMNE